MVSPRKLEPSVELSPLSHCRGAFSLQASSTTVGGHAPCGHCWPRHNLRAGALFGKLQCRSCGDRHDRPNPSWWRFSATKPKLRHCSYLVAKYKLKLTLEYFSVYFLVGHGTVLRFLAELPLYTLPVVPVIVMPCPIAGQACRWIILASIAPYSLNINMGDLWDRMTMTMTMKH